MLIHDPAVSEADVADDDPRGVWMRPSVLSEHFDDRPDGLFVAVEPPGQVGARVGVRVPRDPVGTVDRELGAIVQMTGVREAARQNRMPGRGIGLSKMTKALHPKRPALVPMLDSVVQTYLAHDDLGADAPVGERALALVRGYKRDPDLNRRALRATRRELVRRGHDLTEVRILDLLIWSARVVG